MALKKMISFVFVLVCLVVLSLHATSYFRYLASERTELSARKILQVGMNIDDAREKLVENGFEVSEIETRRGIGKCVFLIKLLNISFLERLECNTEFDLTPFASEPNHWIVVKTKSGSREIEEISAK